MELKCQKCDASVASDQAFCPKCGAVVGMGDAAQNRGGDWDMAATMVGKQLPTTPPPRPATPPPSRPASGPSAAAARPARSSAQAPAHSTPSSAPEEPARSGSNTVLLAVIGFVAVLLIGGLLILLFYLNSKG